MVPRGGSFLSEKKRTEEDLGGLVLDRADMPKIQITSLGSVPWSDEFFLSFFAKSLAYI